jgi:hypothetical protein
MVKSNNVPNINIAFPLPVSITKSRQGYPALHELQKG